MPRKREIPRFAQNDTLEEFLRSLSGLRRLSLGARLQRSGPVAYAIIHLMTNLSLATGAFVTARILNGNAIRDEIYAELKQEIAALGEASSVHIVSSPKVPEPAAARYAWQSYPVATLFNGAGLPAVPFRTDDWPAITASASLPR